MLINVSAHTPHPAKHDDGDARGHRVKGQSGSAGSGLQTLAGFSSGTLVNMGLSTLDLANWAWRCGTYYSA